MKTVLVLALLLAGCSKPAPVAPDPSLHPNDIGHNKLPDHFEDSLTKGQGVFVVHTIGCKGGVCTASLDPSPKRKPKSKHLKDPRKSSETYEALMAEHGVEFSEGFFEERMPLARDSWSFEEITVHDEHRCLSSYMWNEDTGMCSMKIHFEADKQEITCSPIVEGTITCQYKPVQK